MKDTPKGNRLLVYDSAKLDHPLKNSPRFFCNVLVARESGIIAHTWITLRRPDVNELLEELSRFVSEHPQATTQTGRGEGDNRR